MRERFGQAGDRPPAGAHYDGPKGRPAVGERALRQGLEQTGQHDRRLAATRWARNRDEGVRIDDA